MFNWKIRRNSKFETPLVFAGTGKRVWRLFTVPFKTCFPVVFFIAVFWKGLDLDSNQKLALGLLGLIALLVVVNAFFLLGVQKTVSPAQNPLGMEKQTTAIAIVSSNCPKCVSLDGLIEQLRLADVNFSPENLVFEESAQARELVLKYSIESLPALVLFPSARDLNILKGNWVSVGSVEPENVLVLRRLPAPFFDIASNQTKGLVEFWSISKSGCADCSPAPSSDSLGQLGIVFSKTTALEDSDPLAQQLLQTYSITKLPAVVLSSEIQAYSSLQDVLKAGGDFEENGFWVLRNPVPYYWDLTQNKSVGKIELVRILDSNCATCFDLSELEAFLVQSFGLKIAADQNLDWETSEGKAFAEQHFISKLPTIALGGDFFAYPGLEEAWANFGIRQNE